MKKNQKKKRLKEEQKSIYFINKKSLLKLKKNLFQDQHRRRQVFNEIVYITVSALVTMSFHENPVELSNFVLLYIQN